MVGLSEKQRALEQLREQIRASTSCDVIPIPCFVVAGCMPIRKAAENAAAEIEISMHFFLFLRARVFDRDRARRAVPFAHDAVDAGGRVIQQPSAIALLNAFFTELMHRCGGILK